MHDDARRRLEDLAWDNRFQALGQDYGSRQNPTTLPDPWLVAFSPDAAALLDLDPAQASRAEFTAAFAGNAALAGSEPYAHLYGGHQFGVWAGQLGDGRAILLGQVRNRRGQSWDVQLKGAGKTPYSRFADGRATLESTVREYLVSEAMAGLGIATTRALCIVGSNTPVYRETRHQGAVLARLAPSHVRFGSFEVLFYREQFAALAPLADHVIDQHFPAAAALAPGPGRYRAWVEAVIARTADLIGAWQSVGFCHGVMNTDNMSVLGLTLDYGPFGFMDGYQPGWVCNHSDDQGRYAYDQQPVVALWNLGRFVQAVLPLLSDEPETAVAIGQEALASYRAQYERVWLNRMRAKLGLPDTQGGDAALVEDLFTRMDAAGADFTRSFRRLGRAAGGEEAAFVDGFADRDSARAWLDDWRARLASAGADPARCRPAMDAVNPKFVLRNYLAERALERAREGDYGEIERLRRLLRRPFEEQPEREDYARLPPDWASGIVLSCSA